MEIRQYVDKMKEINNSLLNFLDDLNCEEIEEFNNSNEKYEMLLKSIKEHNIDEDRYELIDFIRLIVSIANNHHRLPNFFAKIEKILIYFKNKIKQNLSNDEIYYEFESNKRLLLFLIKEGILLLDEQITNLINCKTEFNGIPYSQFFLPELKKFEQNDQNINNLDEYEKNRQEGENELYICFLIRNDFVVDFISHINRFQISFSSKIQPSIFETNSFLNEREPSLIEYACFFGSVQIFQYIFMSNVKIENSLLLYGIHSNNSDILCNYIEKNVEEDKSKVNKIYLKNKICRKCMRESIKCHHNEIANYFKSNHIDESQMYKSFLWYFDTVVLKKQKKKFYHCVFQYHNYEYFPENFTPSYIFFYLCFYKYTKIVNLYLKIRESYLETSLILIFINLFRLYFHIYIFLVLM